MQSSFNTWVFLFALSSFIASLAQMLLKASAREKHGSVLREYLNWKVIIGYGMMFVGMLLGVIAYGKGVTVQGGSVMESLGNVWVMLLSFLCFREPITKRKLLGNAMIVGGIILFNVL